MKRTDVIIIGGGQAGLAMSRCLADRGIDHAVLERGRIAHRWRTERWDSLRLLSPNWQTRLPCWTYEGDDPDGFMTMPEVIGYLSDYARSFSAPVHEDTSVLSVGRRGGTYHVQTDQGVWTGRAVVVATGHCGTPFVPAMGSELRPDIHQLVPTRYRNPQSLPDGGVLVVGASASGVQIADELRRSGRDIVLAVGRHARMPRTYRGHDIMWWLDRTGVLDDRADEVRDLAASRAAPSLQLVGGPDRATVDLSRLAAAGVELVGRAVGIEGPRVQFDDSLATMVARAEARLTRLLDRIDAFVDGRPGYSDVPPPSRPMPIRATAGPTTLDLRARGIRTVVWATGFRRRYPWLDLPVLDDAGELRHVAGVTDVPGLFALGLQFMRRRKSSTLDGVGHDAEELAPEIHTHLDGAMAA